jgi:hypothetical protein
MGLLGIFLVYSEYSGAPYSEYGVLEYGVRPAKFGLHFLYGMINLLILNYFFKQINDFERTLTL